MEYWNVPPRCQNFLITFEIAYNNHQAHVSQLVCPVADDADMQHMCRLSLDSEVILISKKGTLFEFCSLHSSCTK